MLATELVLSAYFSGLFVGFLVARNWYMEAE